jgi:hypothetical protein
MVERSRRKKEEDMYDRATRMVFATVALSALAVLLTGPAHAYLAQGDGVNAVSSQQRQQAQLSNPGPIPYLSQGVGVDKSRFAGQAPRTVASQQTPVAQPTIPYLSQGTGVDPARFGNEKTTVAPLPHGIQVVLSPPGNEQPLGLTGDSPLTRASGVGQEGSNPSTGSPSPTTYPSSVIGASSQWDGHTLPPTIDVSTIQVPPQVGTASSGNDFDWASFGAGAGMVALLAAVLGGALLTARRRHSVGLP